MKRWRLRHAGVAFEPRNLWVGAMWYRDGEWIELWVQPLPCVEVNLAWARWEE